MDGLTNEDIRSLIIEVTRELHLISQSALDDALSSIVTHLASENDLRKTNAIVVSEQNARLGLEQRLGRLETDVQDIALKMAAILHGMGEMRTQQGDHIEDLKLMRNEVQALSTASDTLLQLSKERQVITTHILETQSKHGELLSGLTDEGIARTEELERLEQKLITTQTAIIANQSRLEVIAEQIKEVGDAMGGLGPIVTMVTSRWSRTIAVGIITLLVSDVLNIDVQLLIEFLVRILSPG